MLGTLSDFFLMIDLEPNCYFRLVVFIGLGISSLLNDTLNYFFYMDLWFDL